MKQRLFFLCFLFSGIAFAQGITAESMEQRLSESYFRILERSEGYPEDLLHEIDWAHQQLDKQSEGSEFYRVHYILSALHMEAHFIPGRLSYMEKEAHCFKALELLEKSAMDRDQFMDLLKENPLQFKKTTSLISNVCGYLYINVNMDMDGDYQQIKSCQELLDKTYWLNQDFYNIYWELRYDLQSRVMHGTKKMTAFQEVSEDLLSGHHRIMDDGKKDREYWNTVSHYIHRLSINHYQPKAREIMDKEFSGQYVDRVLPDVFSLRRDGTSALLSTLIELGYTEALNTSVQRFKSQNDADSIEALKASIEQSTEAIGKPELFSAIFD